MKIESLYTLEGKVAVVTGGAGYLGSSMCSILLAAGARVLAVGRGQSKTYDDQLVDNPNFDFLQCDLSQEIGVTRVVDRIKQSYGHCNVLINNAFTWPQNVSFEKLDWGSINQTLNMGLTSQLVLTQKIFEMMVDAGNGGSIINVGSMYGKVAPDFSMYKEPGMGNAVEYGVTKGGIDQVTKYVASMGGEHRIRCNTISPGPFSRPGSFDGKEWFEDELNQRVMLGRVGKPEELQGAVLLLASEMGSYITGIDLPVDGGWTAW